MLGDKKLEGLVYITNSSILNKERIVFYRRPDDPEIRTNYLDENKPYVALKDISEPPYTTEVSYSFNLMDEFTEICKKWLTEQENLHRRGEYDK